MFVFRNIMKQNSMIHIVFFVLSLFQAVTCSDRLCYYDKKLEELETKAIENRARADKLWKKLNLAECVNQQQDEISAWHAEMEAVAAEALLQSEKK